jgi:hypothetical protein
MPPKIDLLPVNAYHADMCTIVVVMASRRRHRHEGLGDIGWMGCETAMVPRARVRPKPPSPSRRAQESGRPVTKPQADSRPVRLASRIMPRAPAAQGLPTSDPGLQVRVYFQSELLALGSSTLSLT